LAAARRALGPLRRAARATHTKRLVTRAAPPCAHAPDPHPPKSPPYTNRITIGALEDLYGNGSVNYAVAEPYSCPPPSARPADAAGRAEAEAAAEAAARAKGFPVGVYEETEPVGSLPVPGVPELEPLRRSVDPFAP
jgi:hypothetical protein